MFGAILCRDHTVPHLIDPRTIAFQLYDVMGADALCDRPRFSDYSCEAFDAVLESAKGIATELYAPHQKANDTDEPRIEAGKVVLNLFARIQMLRFARIR